MTFSFVDFSIFVLGALSSVVTVWILGRRWFKSVRLKAENLVEIAKKEAEIVAREIQTKARLETEKDKAEAEKEISIQQTKLAEKEREFLEKKEVFAQDRAKFEEEKLKLQSEFDKAEAEQKKFETYSETYRSRLKQIGKLSDSDAQQIFREEVLRSCADEVNELRKELLFESEEQIKQEASRMLVDSMQRIATSPHNDISATIVQIPNEEMKGRIIGREGRNIKAFELATGTTLMIDETPGSILVSSFDPVRREVAKMSLERLVKDGRIHPVSIEETVHQVMDEMKDHVTTLGEEAILKLRLTGIHPEVVSLLGKLHYRLSNNQNTLDHSVEVGFFCSLLASEIGIDPEPAKRAGLFHDMGKAIEHEYEGSHAIAASRILQRYSEDPRVSNAVAAHHNEVPDESIYAGILKIADGLSATRPGARSDSMDGYIQRVKSLERTARSFDGIKEAYALQAGREIRIIVSPKVVDDESAQKLARRIRRKIEDELQYPGQIKVTVIREQRYHEVAK